ncbi:hypothetical protein AEM51_02910 [Bacteroidetes bacterium UKL13-3]|nr:hypothetical protein AEM51_02910 [Bacteroidetes bacterium UKL13-3]
MNRTFHKSSNNQSVQKGIGMIGYQKCWFVGWNILQPINISVANTILVRYEQSIWWHCTFSFMQYGKLLSIKKASTFLKRPLRFVIVLSI